MPSPFPCSPVACEGLWKKTQIENKILNDISNYKEAVNSIYIDEEVDFSLSTDQCD